MIDLDDDGQPIPEGDRYPSELDRALGWAAANGATLHSQKRAGTFTVRQWIPGAAGWPHSTDDD